MSNLEEDPTRIEPSPDFEGESAPELDSDDEPDPTLLRPLARPAQVGDVIAGKYRLVATLGRGGMGRIFAGEHLVLGTRVALKFMHPHLTRDRLQVARFAREARAAAKLRSEHVARIIDVDTLPTGELYIVMEYLDGSSLEALVEGGRGLPVVDAVRYLVQACDALAEAHARSILHRDVKPANLFLARTSSGEAIIKVLDFGLAKSVATSEDEPSLAPVSTVDRPALGTPYYMSPEQISGGVVDGRTDVWALGATLYELLTGHLAFPGDNAPMVFARVLREKPASLRAQRPDVPEAVLAIVDRCLARDIGARFQTVRELVRALESALLMTTAPAAFVVAPLPVERFARASAPPPPSVPRLEPPSEPVPAREPGGPTARQTLLAALAGPALVVVAAIVFAVVMRRAGGLPRPAVANEHVVLEARSASTARAKAPLAVGPELRVHK